jgi:hypothetical protein
MLPERLTPNRQLSQICGEACTACTHAVLVLCYFRDYSLFHLCLRCRADKRLPEVR